MVFTCALSLDDDEQRPFVPLGVEHADHSRHLHLHKPTKNTKNPPRERSLSTPLQIMNLRALCRRASYRGVSNGDVLQVNARDPLPTTLDHICSSFTRREGSFLLSHRFCQQQHLHRFRCI